MADHDQMNHGSASLQSGTIGQGNPPLGGGTPTIPENILAPTRKYRPQAQPVWEETRERFRVLKRDTEEYVRSNPAKAVFTALGIGFVLALMRRR